VNKQNLVYIIIGLYAIGGIICHVLSARAQARCKHKWVWNRNIEGYWCDKCWKKK
jgi:hypothetical protein